MRVIGQSLELGEGGWGVRGPGRLTQASQPSQPAQSARPAQPAQPAQPASQLASLSQPAAQDLQIIVFCSFFVFPRFFFGFMEGQAFI